ncbi:MAG: hypothetical protein F6J93_23185 [Oscillatoria sp. SIO1A7]|nr:hypothetical protein [Oscillatoria sp. SIO1A7]
MPDARYPRKRSAVSGQLELKAEELRLRRGAHKQESCPCEALPAARAESFFARCPMPDARCPMPYAVR